MSSLPVTASVDADQVGWIVFDDPMGRANALTPAVFAALKAAIESLLAQAPKAVVIIGAKEKIFVAGADLKWIASLPDAAAALDVARLGQGTFGLLEKFKVPVVGAIHGACAGGGYELALACDWRIATDAKETTVGLPEVALGLIPGWGGCARLPRLIGAEAATSHILKAALVPAAAAHSSGLVDELVPAVELKARAKTAALRLAAEGKPARSTPAVAAGDFFAKQRETATKRFVGQPAPLAALEAIERGIGQPLANALEVEAAKFAEVTAGEVAKNLIRVFRLKDAAKKTTVDAWYPPRVAGSAAPAAPTRIGIIGAGIMGSGIAQWCAANGFGVILNDLDTVRLKQGVQNIRDIFHEMEDRGLITHPAAHKAMGSIGISTDLMDLEDRDLVIEAITENVAEKQKLFAELAKYIPADCVIASNTSALPLEQIATGVPNPGRVVGLHFFNPVSRMPLVEVVLGRDTTRDTAERALGFAKAMRKLPVIAKSSPGFFTTRTLFFYLNAACQLWEQGAPAEAIDGAMRAWGWPMGPMRLIDEIGVDTSAFIIGEMKQFFPDRFATSSICDRLAQAGWRGRKSGAGFYLYAEGKTEPNPDVAKLAPAAGKTPEATAIQSQLNGVLLDETKRALAEGIVKSADDADLALLLGAGFPAHRGGLLHCAGIGG